MILFLASPETASPVLALPPEILRGIRELIDTDEVGIARAALIAAIESWGHSLVRTSGDLREAAQRFLAKYDEVEPAIIDAFAFKQGHGMTYSGPDFGEELKALRLALSRKESPK